MFTSWVNFFNNELADVVAFFQSVFAIFPSRLVSILFFFPAISIVFGLVTYARRTLKGD